MAAPKNKNANSSSKKGTIIIICALLLNAIGVFLFTRYILYPITDISDLRTLSSAVSEMKVLRKMQRDNITMIVYEGSDNEHYVITLEKNYHEDRYRVLSSGSYAIEEPPPISVSARTFTGVVQYKLGEKYQLSSYTQLNAPTYKTMAEKYMLLYAIVCIIEILFFYVIFLIRRKKCFFKNNA